MCDLYDHIQKKNDGNGLDEFEAKTIFRQVGVFMLPFSRHKAKTIIFATPC